MNTRSLLLKTDKERLVTFDKFSKKKISNIHVTQLIMRQIIAMTLKYGKLSKKRVLTPAVKDKAQLC